MNLLKSIFQGLRRVFSNCLLTQAQYLIAVFVKPIVFLLISLHNFWQAMPIGSIAFNNKITIGQIKINEPGANLLLTFKRLIQGYQNFFYSKLNRGASPLLQGACEASQAITRAEQCISISNFCWFCFEWFSASLACSIYQSVH